MPQAIPFSMKLSDIKPGRNRIPFDVGTGDYTFHLKIGSDLIKQTLRLVYHSRKWTQVVEVFRNEAKIFSTPTLQDQPDISLQLVNLRRPALVLHNESRNLVIRDPYFHLLLWDLDDDKSDQPVIDQKASLARPWIAPRENSDLVGINGAHVDKPGRRFFGVVSVTCPDCAATKWYRLRFTVQESGWYEELPLGTSGMVFTPTQIHYWRTSELPPDRPGSRKAVNSAVQTF